MFRCGECGKCVKSAQGLKSHITRLHQSSASQTYPKTIHRLVRNVAQGVIADDQVQYTGTIPLCELLTNTRAACHIIRRIPKGARVCAAEALVDTIDRCTTGNSEPDWKRLLMFPIICLQVPRRQEADKDVSLTTLVKRNIAGFLQNSGPSTLQHSSVRKKNKKEKVNSDSLIAKLVETKISDGDVNGAVRVLCSEDSLAPHDAITLSCLRSKHPPSYESGEKHAPPDASLIQPLVVTDKEVKGALLSFPAGSSAGLDALRPQHLKDLIAFGTGNAGLRLLTSLTKLCNHMLSGLVPKEVCPILYGANLCALNKKDGGVRPIAVGNTYRRLVAKLGCNCVRDRLGALLQPTQLGFGTRGGAEAVVHAARRYLEHNHEDEKVFLKIDFRNAFNTVNRVNLLNSIQEKIPELYAFLQQCYRYPSILSFGEEFISSECGLQQGDPLAPALFCLLVHPISVSLKSELNLWYLDDVTLADSPETVLDDFRSLKSLASELGLEVNTSKCEISIVGSTDASSTVGLFENEISGLKRMEEQSTTLLGAPLNSASMVPCLDAKTEALDRGIQRLKLVGAHCSFFLLKNSQAIPKLVYTMRCAPTWQEQESLQKFDNTLKMALETVCNVKMDEKAWTQSSLPVSKGGLGIRQAESTALPAFIASVNSVSGLVKNILPDYIQGAEDPALVDAQSLWRELSGQHTPSEELSKFQKEWERPMIQKRYEELHEAAINLIEKARLVGVSSRESGAWLNALPSPSLGTLLDDNSFRIAIALRLGAEVCQPHPCLCGALVDSSGVHGLSCKKSAGRLSRHAAMNDLVRRALVSAGIPAALEPTGLERGDGKRPDGMTLVPWSGGKSMIWDVTCVNTLADSYIASTSVHQGWAAGKAEERKKAKYLGLRERYSFHPIAVETLGTFGPESLATLHSIGRRIAQTSGEKRSTSFLIQRLSVSVQRGNAASIMNTIPSGASLDDVLHLL